MAIEKSLTLEMLRSASERLKNQDMIPEVLLMPRASLEKLFERMVPSENHKYTNKRVILWPTEEYTI